jgi:hypothetical protein
MPLLSNCDLNDVDILYVLEPHGWSTCILYIGDMMHSIDSISHVKDNSFEKNRSGEFPYVEFHKLESLFLT